VTVSIKNPRSTSVLRHQHNLKVIIPIISEHSVQELALCAGTLLCCIAAKFKWKTFLFFLFCVESFAAWPRKIAAAAITTAREITVGGWRGWWDWWGGKEMAAEPRNVNRKQTANSAVTLIFTCPWTRHTTGHKWQLKPSLTRTEFTRSFGLHWIKITN